jgi:hypothetical protein
VRRGGDEAQTHVLAPSSPDDPTKETENASEGGGAGVVRQAAAGQQFYTVLLHNGQGLIYIAHIYRVYLYVIHVCATADRVI